MLNWTKLRKDTLVWKCDLLAASHLQEVHAERALFPTARSISAWSFRNLTHEMLRASRAYFLSTRLDACRAAAPLSHLLAVPFDYLKGNNFSTASTEADNFRMRSTVVNTGFYSVWNFGSIHLFPFGHDTFTQIFYRGEKKRWLFRRFLRLRWHFSVKSV